MSFWPASEAMCSDVFPFCNPLPPSLVFLTLHALHVALSSAGAKGETGSRLGSWRSAEPRGPFPVSPSPPSPAHFPLHTKATAKSEYKYVQRTGERGRHPLCVFRPPMGPSGEQKREGGNGERKGSIPLPRPICTSPSDAHHPHSIPFLFPFPPSLPPPLPPNTIIHPSVAPTKSLRNRSVP